MARYLLSVYQPEGEPPPADELDTIMREVGELEEAMRSAGVWVFSGGLEAPDTATVVRASGGSDGVLVTDGPFVELKEYLGGFTVIEVDDLDAALRWGRRTAETIGLPIEVRPFQRSSQPTGP